MKQMLHTLITDGLQACFAQGSLSSGEVPEILLEVPNNPEHGDFATNVAMTMARAEKKAPRQIAQALVDAMTQGENPCESVEIAGPGFINFRLKPVSWFALLDEVYSRGIEYGQSDIGNGTSVQVEFVSANPTGPLHIGHGRGAAVGDAVASLLGKAGFDVQREYYINDAGNQVTMMGTSIWARVRELRGEQVEFPEDGYRGDYIRDVAADLLKEQGDKLAGLSDEEAVLLCGDYGIQVLLEIIRRDLESFGVEFDRWYSERSLYERDMVAKELAELKKRDLTFEEEGALWLRTTDYDDDKDRVLLRSDGSPTYFASDVAYHMEKFDRGFNRVIDVWGADHHGYIPRMKAMLAGLGHPPEDLEVLMIQMVNLLRDGQPVTMGKRSGEFVTLRDVVEEVGRDACRYFFLMRRADSQLDFDLELAKQQSNDNPVYYAQYAHARVCSVNRNAAEAGIRVPTSDEVDLSVLTHDNELALAKLISRYPGVIEGAALGYEPHRVVFYLHELASRFHSDYNRCRVLGEAKEVAQARLYLMNAVRLVLHNALTLLGISAPEKM